MDGILTVVHQNHSSIATKRASMALQLSFLKRKCPCYQVSCLHHTLHSCDHPIIELKQNDKFLPEILVSNVRNGWSRFCFSQSIEEAAHYAIMGFHGFNSKSTKIYDRKRCGHRIDRLRNLAGVRELQRRRIWPPSGKMERSLQFIRQLHLQQVTTSPQQ